MRKPTPLDWIGAVALWAGASSVLAIFLHDGMSVGEPPALLAGFSAFFGGVALARWRWLRRPVEDTDGVARVGLSTGEMTAQRLAEMEARIYELEERLELTERLLMEARERPRLPLVREETPV